MHKFENCVGQSGNQSDAKKSLACKYNLNVFVENINVHYDHFHLTIIFFVFTLEFGMVQYIIVFSLKVPNIRLTVRFCVTALLREVTNNPF